MNRLPPVRNRIISIDLLRGIVMVTMALDHVRDFFHLDALQQDPLNLATTTPPLFLTRWITHFCAPVFVFLAGVSIYLAGLRRTRTELRIFLITRGLWLIAIEIVVMTFALSFNPTYNLVILDTLWAIGTSMIVVGLLINLPWKALLAIGLIIVAGHNLLDVLNIPQKGAWQVIWHFIYGFPAVFPLSKTHTLIVAYTFLSWTGIMILGYVTGRLFAPGMEVKKRIKILWLAGAIAILLFIVLRWANVYGNPVPWSVQKKAGFTLLSFLNVNKYPPSLLFTCMTLGPALILLAVFEQAKSRLSALLVIYGRVPFFYFIIHFFLVHLLLVIAFFLSGYGIKDIASPPFYFHPPQLGYPLGIVYIIWILVVVLMYPICRWYAQYKRTHTQWWLSYL
ncbi:MAG TPA: heparan-alpha-glucosaminide N-acetyltransferase domain-containing protein [Chitinophagaceae bacterium]